ncbi:MAG: phosphate acyltransferase PlsX [Kiritimatiellaeota bacterium]|nr:phosphate acyltransferase PlsX [Kiritimatiellota bacterium]
MPVRIAVDAMGGDHAPREIVRGCVEAARHLKGIDELVLFGDEPTLHAELAAYKPKEPKGISAAKITVVHTTQVITMEDSPTQAVRAKPDASMNRAIKSVREEQADALVSAGNTGALVAASIFGLRRIPGLKRPALGAVIPTLDYKRPLLILDVGATPDCTEVELEQFAIMGHVYSHVILHQATPSIGLLSIGTEETKGNEVTRKTFEVLSRLSSISFAGNVEGHSVFNGEIDVVVCDGFVGNVMLKTIESVARTIGHWMRHEIKRSIFRMFGALFLSGAIYSMKKKMNPDLYGGAPLLGVNGIVIKAHGHSKKNAIFHAIRVAAEAVAARMTEQIAAHLDKLRSVNEPG